MLRAVENERDLVRAAITGISGIVDAKGRILAETAPGERALVRGAVRLERGATAWTRWGYRIPLAADAAAAAVLIFGLVRRLRRVRLTAHGFGGSRLHLEMTERDDLVSSLSAASERLAVAPRLSLISTRRGARSTV